MKAGRFVSALLVLLICFSSFGVNAAITLAQTAPPLTEQSASFSEESQVIHDPNWIPTEMQLTEEEYAALDPPNNVVELEYPPLLPGNGGALSSANMNLPNAGVPEAGLMSAATVSGIKQFQQYINSNLPISYLGTALAVDGNCGPATKTATIKLIQYRLNQMGAGLTVDGGFGTLSQQAFSKYVGTIERYDTGVWVYILQGLLYCNDCDPNGFDGSYGVNGGTGCLNAVNKFKEVNVIVEGGSGTVGIEMMKCLVWRAPVRIIDDGVYYMKNNYSSYYANVYNGGINALTEVQQLGINTSAYATRLQQLWKIRYLGSGCYSIRPMHKLDMGLSTYNNEIVIRNFIEPDQLSQVSAQMRWTVSQSGSSFIFMNAGDTTKTLTAPGNTAGINLMASSDTSSRTYWTLERENPAPEGVLIYNASSGTPYTDLTRYMAPGSTKTLGELRIKTAVYSENDVTQALTWESLDTSKATVNSTTGQITAKSPGLVTVRGKKLLSGTYKYVDIDVYVSEIENGTYFIQNKGTRRHTDIKNQTMSDGTIIHQWEFHGGNTQKWNFILRDDGYYVIYSENSSAYYLGVEGDSTEIGAAILLRTAQAQDGLLWRVYPTSSDSYMIKAKTGYVLSLKADLLANGVLLQQNPYTDDSNYTDEWHLCLPSTEISLEIQEQDKWCWAACAKMLVQKFMKHPLSQSSLAVYIKLGILTDSPTPEQIVQSNDLEALSKLKEAADFLIGGDKYYYEDNKIYSEETLRSLLAQNNPVAICRTRMGFSHVLIIYDYYWYEPGKQYIYKIYDPWNKDNVHLYEKSYRYICIGKYGCLAKDGLDDDGIWDGVVVYKEGEYTNTISCFS